MEESPYIDSARQNALQLGAAGSTPPSPLSPLASAAASLDVAPSEAAVVDVMSDADRKSDTRQAGQGAPGSEYDRGKGCRMNFENSDFGTMLEQYEDAAIMNMYENRRMAKAAASANAANANAKAKPKPGRRRGRLSGRGGRAKLQFDL